MASNVSHQLSIVIGAALGSGFNSTVSGSTSKIRQIGSAIKDMEKQSSLSERSINKLKNRYNSLLGSINKQQSIIQKRAFYRSQIVDIIALGASLAAPINAAMKFESALADVAKVVDFSAADGLQKMGQSIKELSRTIPIAVEGLAQITAAGGQLGVAEKDLLPFTKNVAKMSTAFDMMPSEAGQAMATLSNVFDIPITDLTKLGDAINHLSNNSAASAKNIIPALAKMGGAARQFGLTAEKSSALVGTMIAMGRAPEEAGTAAAAILQRLQLADKLGVKAEKAFRKIGLSAKVFKKMIATDAQGALSKFFDMVAKINPQERASVLVDIFGKNYSNIVAMLVGSLGKYKEQLDLVSNSKIYSGSMEKEFLARSATTENSIQIMQNAFSELGITLGYTLLPTVDGIVKGISSVTQSISSWLSKNADLAQIITHLVGGLIGFKVSTFALGYASTFLQAGLNKLVIVFKGLRLGLALAATAFRSFLTVGGVFKLITAAWLIIENWEYVKSFFLKIWDSVEPYWLKFKAILDKFGITDKIMASWTKLKEFFSGIWKSILPQLERFSNLTSKIWNSAKSPFSAIGNLFSANDNKQSLKLPPIKSGNSPVTKNQNTNVVVNVNASKITDSKEVAKQVSREMKSFNWSYLYDPVGELP